MKIIISAIATLAVATSLNAADICKITNINKNEIVNNSHIMTYESYLSLNDKNIDSIFKQIDNSFSKEEKEMRDVHIMKLFKIKKFVERDKKKNRQILALTNAKYYELKYGEISSSSMNIIGDKGFKKDAKISQLSLHYESIVSSLIEENLYEEFLIFLNSRTNIFAADDKILESDIYIFDSFIAYFFNNALLGTKGNVKLSYNVYDNTVNENFIKAFLDTNSFSELVSIIKNDQSIQEAKRISLLEKEFGKDKTIKILTNIYNLNKFVDQEMKKQTFEQFLNSNLYKQLKKEYNTTDDKALYYGYGYVQQIEKLFKNYDNVRSLLINQCAK